MNSHTLSYLACLFSQHLEHPTPTSPTQHILMTSMYWFSSLIVVYAYLLTAIHIYMSFLIISSVAIYILIASRHKALPHNHPSTNSDILTLMQVEIFHKLFTMYRTSFGLTDQPNPNHILYRQGSSISVPKLSLLQELRHRLRWLSTDGQPVLRSVKIKLHVLLRLLLLLPWFQRWSYWVIRSQHLNRFLITTKFLLGDNDVVNGLIRSTKSGKSYSDKSLCHCVMFFSSLL